MPSSAPDDVGGVMNRRRDQRRCSRRCTRPRALRVEHDRLVVARLERLDLGERGVDVVAGRLRGRRHGVVVVARPRDDLHAHPLGERVVAEVGAPRPARDGHVHRARQRVEPHLAVAVVGDRADVADGEPGRPHGSFVASTNSSTEYGMSIIRIFAELRSRSMCSVSRNTRRPAVGLVGADALEHAGAVVERVREHVDLGVRPSRRARRSSRSSASA